MSPSPLPSVVLRPPSPLRLLAFLDSRMLCHQTSVRLSEADLQTRFRSLSPPPFRRNPLAPYRLRQNQQRPRPLLPPNRRESAEPSALVRTPADAEPVERIQRTSPAAPAAERTLTLGNGFGRCTCGEMFYGQSDAVKVAFASHTCGVDRGFDRDDPVFDR